MLPVALEATPVSPPQPVTASRGIDGRPPPVSGAGQRGFRLALVACHAPILPKTSKPSSIFLWIFTNNLLLAIKYCTMYTWTMTEKQELENLTKKIVLVAEAAQILGCSVQRVHQLAAIHGLATQKKSKNAVFFLRRQIEALAREPRPVGRPAAPKLGG